MGFFEEIVQIQENRSTHTTLDDLALCGTITGRPRGAFGASSTVA